MRSICCFLIHCCLLLTPLAGSDAASESQPVADRRQPLLEAERLLRDGKFDAAASAYEALDIDRLPIEAVYNLGVAHYRCGRMDRAGESFRRAAAAESSSLAGKARFNLGNAHYVGALESLQAQPPPDPDEVIERLQLAIDQYRSALRIAPFDTDARANIELAGKLLKQLRDQQKQEEQEQQNQQQKEQGDSSQEEQKNQRQKDQEQSEQQQGEHGDEQQQGEQQQGEQQQGEQQQGEQQQSEQQQSEQQQSEQQQDEQQQGEQQRNEQQQDQQSNGQPQDQSGQERAESGDQEHAEQSPSEDGQGEEETTPAGELKAANAGEEQTDQPVPMAGEPGQAMQMTQQEARKMLQAIRDRNMLRRLRRQAAERIRHIPVERDW